MRKPTLVTALYDLKRNELSPGFSREFSHYLECFKKLLAICHHIPMVIYCDDNRVKELVAAVRDTKNTVIVHKKIESILPPSFIKKIDSIRQNDKWYGQSSWLKDSPQCALDGYNTLVMGKQFMLNDASILNHFNSDRFFWIDAAISNTCSPAYLTDEKIVRGLLTETRSNKMLYLCFPYDGKTEVHGFTKEGMNRYAGEDTKFVARGGFFGGTREAINRINEPYYHTLGNSLNEGLMGTEESIFTILAYRHKDLVNCQFIESNGLIYKFFEDMKQKDYTPYSGTALYFLTFNLPKQLEYCLESFSKAHPDVFHNCKKYLINNSTDTATAEDYEKIVIRYDIEEIRFDNIGICGARQFAAQHFEETNFEFMIFLEDDMIFNDTHYRPALCKSGFATYTDDLFYRCTNIIYENDLDYLKLSFSEFFGDNHKNWSWYNMGEEDRKQWLYEIHNNNQIYTKVHYTGTFRSLPYAVGEYHYCNWPIIFTRRGNRRVFLEKLYEHPYEQIWMAETQKRLRSGNVRAGVLLASPLRHDRKHHYNREQRKES